MSKALRQRRGLCPRYTIAPGRTIEREGTPILRVSGVAAGGPVISHADTDRFARRIVQLLNKECVTIGIRRGGRPPR